MEAVEGELRVAEARPHGSSVKQGEVVLRLEDDKLKDMVRSAEWALRIAERNAADVKERYAEHEEDTKRDVGRAEKDLALARKSLKGYLEVNRALEKEEYELGERSQRHAIEDQDRRTKFVGVLEQPAPRLARQLWDQSKPHQVLSATIQESVAEQKIGTGAGRGQERP